MDLLRCCLDRYLDSLDTDTADSGYNQEILFTVGFATARLVSLTRVQQRALLLSASTAELSRILRLLPLEDET
jgi:hypothetical protein